MAYTINLTNGTVFAVISDGTTNTNSSVTLIGKNYAGYGEFLDDNFIQMLENFSSASSAGNPTNAKLASPLTGQLWWDSTNSLMKVYTGTGWKVPTGTTASASTPTVTLNQGDLWYDTTNQQVKVYNGASFLVVGPAFTASQGTSGAIPLSINDSGGTPHVVTGMYAANTLVSITSPDATFVPAAPYATDFPQIFRGTTVYNSGALGGNISSNTAVIITSAGTAQLSISATGTTATGFVSAGGNVTGANLLTTGLVTVTGNIIGGNLQTAGQASATGNVIGGNINTAGLASVTGNVIGGNISTAGIITAVGNVNTSGGVLATGNVRGGNLISAGTATVTGTITAGNVSTAGTVSATGNISSAGNVSAAFVLGNGSQLTGLSSAVSVTRIVNGLSNAAINTSDGNLAVTIGGVANVMVVTTTQAIVGNLLVTNDITTTGNSTGNIGTAANPFNTVFAKATTAQYADVAERFAADEILSPGTVVELGGPKEITRVRLDLSENVFGVISTRPAYTMNGLAGSDDTHPPVAMTGRVPVLVIGKARKGDRLVSAGNGVARAAGPGEATAFNTIGRVLEDKNSAELGTTEAIVAIR